MAKINEQTAQKIKDAASIIDVIRDAGIELHRKGANLECLCPFHEDRSFGSFVVNARGNYYKCFSCGASGDPVKFVMEYHGMKYPDALRYLAAMYGIFVDDEPAPQVVKREPRQPLPPRKWMVWPLDIVKPYMHHGDTNPLLIWMNGLPMTNEHKHNLRNMIELYMVGTSLRGYTQGWTIWPQVDEKLQVRDMKFMAYKADGHRDKTHNPNWMSSMLAKAGQFDIDNYQPKRCLFGQHLAAIFPDAEVCLVESEKTAVICSAFCDPNKRIWMAVGGLQFFRAEMLESLIEAGRYIVVYPDVDGMQQWEEAIKAIGYNRMSMTLKMRSVSEGGEYIASIDGPKADIADIMIRKMNGVEESEAEKACRLLGLPDTHEGIAALINKLNLEIVQ